MKFKTKDKIIEKTREYTNHIFGWYRRMWLENKSFTIISNNCWGGHVYRFFNLSYQSPFVGLYVFSDDYIKILTDLKRYLSLPLEFISVEESKWKSILIDRNHGNVPIAKLGDAEIIFLHYKSKEEAYEKWNRRLNRMNWSKLIVKMSEQNCCTIDHLKAFDSLPYRIKFVFTSRDYKLNSQVVFKEYLNENSGVMNDTTLFRKYVNLINLINGKSFKLKQ